MHRQWRNKPSKEIIKKFEESIDIKLYLIQEKGPLSFVVQDENKKKFTISIGKDICCTCKVSINEHCVHSIYILNRIFKISFTDPLIIQVNYSDSELAKMVEFRNKSVNSIKKIPETKLGNNVTIPKINKMNLFDDQTCPICQEDMYDHEGLFVCKDSCGHNFHINCLKIWSEHKKSSSDTISCPMCRANWNEEDLKKSSISLMGESTISKCKKSHKGVNCKNCERKNIKGERFHCLNCIDLDICIECFNLGLHDQSHNFVVKKSPEEKWYGLTINKNRQDGDIFNELQCLFYTIKNINLTQHLTTLIPDFINYETSQDSKNFLSEQVNTENDFENFVNQNDDIPKNSNNVNKCLVCKSDRVSSLQLLKLKVLPCNHVIHYKCSESLFKNEQTASSSFGYNKCKIDNKVIFPGLTSISINIISKNNSLKKNACESNHIKSIIANHNSNIRMQNNLNLKQNFESALTILSFPIDKQFNKQMKKPQSVNSILRKRLDRDLDKEKLPNQLDKLCLDIKKVECHQNKHLEIKNNKRKTAIFIQDDVTDNKLDMEGKIENSNNPLRGLKIINLNTMRMKVILFDISCLLFFIINFKNLIKIETKRNIIYLF